MSQIVGDDLWGYRKLGFNGGLRVVAVLNDRWRIGPEILFSQQGSQRGTNELNVSDFDRIHYNTVSVPLMVYFKDWRFTAEAGVAYQRLINYTIEDQLGEDITDDILFSENLLALQLGATLYLNPRWGLNVRWSRQLNDLEANTGNLSLNGNSISIRAVYTFGDGEEIPEPLEIEE